MTALHGFLGRPEDWDGVLGNEWTKPNWLLAYQSRQLMPSMNRESGSRDFLDRLAAYAEYEATGDVLLGYSMGGRIALHMLIQSPIRWRKAIIVSASPGLTDKSERLARYDSDLRWAGRFQADDWSSVVNDWNGQEVFAHDPPDRLPRREEDYDREYLASAFFGGSVARQRDLRVELRSIELPILWIAGESDSKYVALAEECVALNPLFSARILPAGHRVPWGATDAFQAAVEDFIKIEP